MSVISPSPFLKRHRLPDYRSKYRFPFEDDLIWKLEHRQVTPQGSGVGLVNINSRLKLLFGDRYGLSIYNEDGMAIVLLSIPKEREDSYAQIDDCR